MGIRIILFTICMAVAVGCGTSENSSESETVRYGSTIMVENPEISLDRYVRRLTGVSVHGSGSGAEIQIRGAETYWGGRWGQGLDSRPIYIIDGVRIGRDFSQLYNLVDMTNVESVQVLRPPRATQLYGTDGGFGAIVVNLKKRN